MFLFFNILLFNYYLISNLIYIENVVIAEEKFLSITDKCVDFSCFSLDFYFIKNILKNNFKSQNSSEAK